jgi:hypothetical protein
MALGSALVDRGRIVRQATTGVKVEGTTIFEPEFLPLFKCRLTLNEDVEKDADPRRKRVTREATLMVNKKDKGHNLVEVRASDRVEVISKQLGTGVWEVTGDPEPLRKRRVVIGWIVGVSRVDDDLARP